MYYRVIELTVKQAKDLGIQGRRLKLPYGRILINTTEGWKIISV